MKDSDASLIISKDTGIEEAKQFRGIFFYFDVALQDSSLYYSCNVFLLAVTDFYLTVTFDASCLKLTLMLRRHKSAMYQITVSIL